MTSRLQHGFRAQKILLPFLDAGLAYTGLIALALTTALLQDWNHSVAAQSASEISVAPSQRSQAFLFVNPTIGEDYSGSESQRSPFRAISHARNDAQPDLGTAEDVGQNQFQQNRRQEVNAAGTLQIIPIAGNQLTAEHRSSKVDLDGQIVDAIAQQYRLVTTSALIGQLPPNPAQLPRSTTVSRSIATLPQMSAAARDDRLTPIRRTSHETVASTAPSRAVPISVSPPENPGVLVSAAPAIDLPASPPEFLMPVLMPALMPSLLSSEAVFMAAVPVSVPFRAPQPFAASGMAIPSGDIFAAVPVVQSSLSLPAPPPTPQLAAVPETSESDDRLSLQASVLPVPDGDAPIGNTGDMPRISVPAGQSWNAGGAVYTPDPVRSMLRYRVVVEASSEQVQAFVRSLIPSAFLISSRGRSLMQVGAFSDRDNAEEAVRLLNQSGLRAVIQRLE